MPVRLLAELKRRNVIRMAGLYLVGAWLIVQIAETLLPIFHTPEWVLQALVVIVALGFVPVLVFSWVFELTPDGLRRDADVLPGQSIAPQTARRMNHLIVAGLALLIVLMIAERMWPRTAPVQAVVPASADSTRATPPTSSLPAPDKSIAVLAFTDLSAGKDQEYFSDGIAEEILNALVKVKDLRVAGRTSSFHYKGRNEDLRSIGRALGVAHLLEGSVRKQGERVRITAQLIRSDDGFHLWSETYDGELTDIFELQDRIARAIVGELKVILHGDEGARLVNVATRNAEAYALYLKATAAFNQRDYPRMGEAIGWLEEAVRLDPQFARAHSRLAMIHLLGQQPYGASDAQAERHARLALALDPALAEPQVALAGLARSQRHFVDARALMDRAIELAPDDASVNLYDAQLFITTGYTRQGIARLDRALATDPMLPNALYWRAYQHLFAGDVDAAERMLERARDLGLSFAAAGLADVARVRGDYVTARALRQPFLSRNNNADCLKSPAVSLPILLEGTMGGDGRARALALAVLDECLAARPAVLPQWAPIALLRLGQPQRAFAAIAMGPTRDDVGLFKDFWMPENRNSRALPEFGAFARKVGFAELWDRYGAPDGCRKNAANDYVCE